MDQILLAYGPHKETVPAQMMLNKNTKATIRSLDGVTDCFEIVAEVLHGDTSTPYLLIISRDHEIIASTDQIKNGLIQKIQRTEDIPHKLSLM